MQVHEAGTAISVWEMLDLLHNTVHISVDIFKKIIFIFLFNNSSMVFIAWINISSWQASTSCGKWLVRMFSIFEDIFGFKGYKDWGLRILDLQSSFFGPHSSILNPQSLVLNLQSLVLNPHCFCIFSCPEQLNRWPCHSLTDSQYFFYWHTKSNPGNL